MSVEKNITMRQFNGTDYDTLYPKTDVKQIENLTPSSIGAVAKSGDTMTGPLSIQRNGGVTSLNVNSYGAYVLANNGDSNVGRYLYLGTLTGRPTNEGALILNVKDNNGHEADYPILHTGNAQVLGYPKIATGSYVGTGTSDAYGGTKQNSLTFDFEPKMLAVVADGDNMFFAGFLIVRGQTYSDGIGSFTNSTVALNLHITWSGNTVSWLSNNRTDVGTKYPQVNAENTTYRCVALG